MIYSSKVSAPPLMTVRQQPYKSNISALQLVVHPLFQASLRAAVFTVVDEHERASGVHLPNPSALDVKHDVVGEPGKSTFSVFENIKDCARRPDRS